VGDVDADGVEELVVGEPFANAGAISGLGRVHMISGGTLAFLLTLTGSGAGTLLGYVVRGVGDVDGNGVPDFGALALGRDDVLLYSGATGMAMYAFLGGGAQFALRGFAGAGDVDGDGFGDVVLGYPWMDFPPGVYDAGEASVHAATSGGPILTVSGWASWQVLGTAVAPAGDVNLDGIPDLLVGAPTLYPLIASTAAFALTYSGADGSLIYSVTSNPLGGDGFGRSLAGGVDVTQDGVPDAIVGASLTNYGAGAAHLVSGSTGSIVMTLIDPSSPQGGLGANVGFAGDVNGDGWEDLLVTQLGAVSGQPTPGRVIVYSGSNGQGLLTFSDALVPNGYARSASRAGDLDGDEFPDILVGATPSFGAGKVFAYSGAPPGISTFGVGCTSSSGTVPRVGATGSPLVGASFSVHVSRTIGGTLAVLLLGVSDSMWGAVPLPARLGPLGMPGCNLLTSVDFAVPVLTSPGGAATMSLAVPSSGSLVGVTAFAQWYVVDPGPAPLPGAMTRGLRIEIQ
jgi:hypothetical protein